MWVEDLGVFDAEAVAGVSEGVGGVGEDGVEGLDGETVCEVAYCVDVDLEVCFVPLQVSAVMERGWI